MRLNRECGSHAACRAPRLAVRSLSEVAGSALSTTALLSRATSAADAENGRSRRVRCVVPASWNSVTPPPSRRNAAPVAVSCCRSSRSHGVPTRTDTSAGLSARRVNRATRASTAARTPRCCCVNVKTPVAITSVSQSSRNNSSAFVAQPANSVSTPTRWFDSGMPLDMSARFARRLPASNGCTSITTMTQGRSEDSCAPSATPSWGWPGTTLSGSRPRSSTYGR